MLTERSVFSPVVRRVLSLVVVLLFAGGCGPGAEPTGPAEPAPALTPSSAQPSPERVATQVSPQPTETEEALQVSPQETPLKVATVSPADSTNRLPQIEYAVADLAQRLDIPADAVEVVEVELVTWPDGGLGCPQPGMAYTQVPQDGLLIRLQAGGETYEYHSGGGRDPFLCEQAAAPQKSTPIFDEEDVLTRTGSEEE